MMLRVIVLILTHGVVAATAGGQEPLPDRIQIGQESYEVEYTPPDRERRQVNSRVPEKYRFTDDEFKTLLDEEFRRYYGWTARHFLRSPSGRWGLPLVG